MRILTAMNELQERSPRRRLYWITAAVAVAVLATLLWPVIPVYKAVGAIPFAIRCDQTIPDDVRVRFGFVPKKIIDLVIEARRNGLPSEYPLEEIPKHGTEPLSASLQICETGIVGDTSNRFSRRYPESETMLLEFEYANGRVDYQTVPIPWESAERPVNLVISLPKQDR